MPGSNDSISTSAVARQRPQALAVVLEREVEHGAVLADADGSPVQRLRLAGVDALIEGWDASRRHALRRLDLEHLRPEVREQPARELGALVRKVKDSDARQEC